MLFNPRIMIGIVWMAFGAAFLIGGLMAVLGARRNASWDKKVAKQTFLSGIFGALVGLFALYQGFKLLGVYFN